MASYLDGNDTLISFLIKVYELQNEFYRDTKDNYCRVVFMENFDRTYENKIALYKIIKEIKNELNSDFVSSKEIKNLSIKIFQNQDLYFNLKGESCKR
jgi:hypothetical protein